MNNFYSSNTLEIFITLLLIQSKQKLVDCVLHNQRLNFGAIWPKNNFNLIEE